jgi:hypothetical protein
MYESGEGVPLNFKEATKYYRLASAQVYLEDVFQTFSDSFLTQLGKSQSERVVGAHGTRRGQ